MTSPKGMQVMQDTKFKHFSNIGMASGRLGNYNK